MKTPELDQHWKGECAYIENVTRKKGDVSEMSRDLSTFIRYCKLQRDLAERAGYDDSATYIQHCIDDLVACRKLELAGLTRRAAILKGMHDKADKLKGESNGNT